MIPCKDSTLRVPFNQHSELCHWTLLLNISLRVEGYEHLKTSYVVGETDACNRSIVARKIEIGGVPQVPTGGNTELGFYLCKECYRSSREKLTECPRCGAANSFVPPDQFASWSPMGPQRPVGEGTGGVMPKTYEQYLPTLPILPSKSQPTMPIHPSKSKEKSERQHSKKSRDRR